MSSAPQPVEHSQDPPPLPEAEAREAINRWSQGFFRVRYLGDKIFIDRIVPAYSYTVRLRSQYEERGVAPVSVPYHGQPLDDRGTPPDPWDIPLPPPNDFEERTETLAVPYTDRVSLCPKCAGVGHIACSRCNASGQVTCPHCGGRGFQDSMQPRPAQDAAGKPTTQMVSVRSDCPHCFHGQVTCSSCSGNGRVTCASCEGTGNVRTFDQLTVRFRDATHVELLDPTDLPDDLLRKLKGDTIFTKRAARIDASPGMPAHVESASRTLLEKSHTYDERDTHLLFQELAVERIAVHEVAYKYAGVERRLWIYADGQVHAPDAPWRRDRLWAIIGGIAAAVVLGILVILLLR
ncbi:MAG TPA: hypothetical protein VGK58_06615 [Lacipirellulaceae bacterium]